MHKAPMIVIGIAALGLLVAPTANAAGMEKSAKGDDGNSSVVFNWGGNTNVSQGNKCKNDVDQKAQNNKGKERKKHSYQGAPEMLGSDLMKSKPGKKHGGQEAENTSNIKCEVGNIWVNHPDRH